MNILVTRPEPDASILAHRLETMGHNGVVDALLSPEFFTDVSLKVDGAQGILATSRNGLRAVARRPVLDSLTALPVFAVGLATAGLAMELGFSNVAWGKGHAADMLDLVGQELTPGRGHLLQLAGDELAFDLKGALEAQGYQVCAPTLYRMRSAVAFREQTLKMFAEGVFHGAILLSPRTARVFSKLIETHKLTGQLSGFVLFCMSRNVAEAVEIEAECRIVVAREPRLEEVLALVNLEAAHLT